MIDDSKVLYKMYSLEREFLNLYKDEDYKRKIQLYISVISSGI